MGGFGRGPFGREPFGQWKWSREVLFDYAPTLYKVEDTKSGGAFEAFTQGLRPSFEGLRGKIRDWANLRDPLEVRTKYDEAVTLRLGSRVAPKGPVLQQGLTGVINAFQEFSAPTARFTSEDVGRELEVFDQTILTNNRTVVVAVILGGNRVQTAPPLLPSAGVRWELRERVPATSANAVVEVQFGDVSQVTPGASLTDGYAEFTVVARAQLPDRTEREGADGTFTTNPFFTNWQGNAVSVFVSPTGVFTMDDIGKRISVSGSASSTNNDVFEIIGVIDSDHALIAGSTVADGSPVQWAVLPRPALTLRGTAPTLRGIVEQKGVDPVFSIPGSTLTSDSGQFTDADVGKTLVVRGTSFIEIAGTVTSVLGPTSLVFDGAVPYRENRISYSEEFDRWGTLPPQIGPQQAGILGVQVWNNVTMAPDGTLTADKIAEEAGMSHHAVQRVDSHDINDPLHLAYGEIQTLSVYAKAAERTWIRLAAVFSAYDYLLGRMVPGGELGGQFFNLATGEVGNSQTYPGWSAAITSVGNGWYRCSITGPGGISYLRVQPARESDATSPPPVAFWADGLWYDGEAGQGVYVWGAQMEKGSVATPYIRTSNTSSSVFDATSWELRNNSGIGDHLAVTVQLPSMLSLLAQDFGIEIDTQDSEARQRSWVRNVTQWIGYKGTAKGYSILGAISGYAITPFDLYAVSKTLYETKIPGTNSHEVVVAGDRVRSGEDGSLTDVGGVTTFSAPSAVFRKSDEGRFLRLRSSASNDGLYTIATWVNATTVRLVEHEADVPDAYNGSIRWARVGIYTDLAPRIADPAEVDVAQWELAVNDYDLTKHFEDRYAWEADYAATGLCSVDQVTSLSPSRYRLNITFANSEQPTILSPTNWKIKDSAGNTFWLETIPTPGPSPVSVEIVSAVAPQTGLGTLTYEAPVRLSCDYCASHRTLALMQETSAAQDEGVQAERSLDRLLRRLVSVTPAHVNLIPRFSRELEADFSLSASMLYGTEIYPDLIAPFTVTMDDMPADLYTLDTMIRAEIERVYLNVFFNAVAPINHALGIQDVILTGTDLDGVTAVKLRENVMPVAWSYATIQAQTATSLTFRYDFTALSGEYAIMVEVDGAERFGRYFTVT